MHCIFTDHLRTELVVDELNGSKRQKSRWLLGVWWDHADDMKFFDTWLLNIPRIQLIHVNVTQ